MTIGIYRLLVDNQLRMASIIILTVYLVTIALLMASMAIFILVKMRIVEFEGEFLIWAGFCLFF